MGAIHQILRTAIAAASDPASEVTVVLYLSESCDNRYRQSFEDLGMSIASISDRVVIGSISIGKILNLGYLPYVKKIIPPTEHYLV